MSDIIKTYESFFDMFKKDKSKSIDKMISKDTELSKVLIKSEDYLYDFNFNKDELNKELSKEEIDLFNGSISDLRITFMEKHEHDPSGVYLLIDISDSKFKDFSYYCKRSNTIELVPYFGKFLKSNVNTYRCDLQIDINKLNAKTLLDSLNEIGPKISSLVKDIYQRKLSIEEYREIHRKSKEEADIRYNKIIDEKNKINDKYIKGVSLIYDRKDEISDCLYSLEEYSKEFRIKNKGYYVMASYYIPSLYAFGHNQHDELDDNTFKYVNDFKVCKKRLVDTFKDDNALVSAIINWKSSIVSFIIYPDPKKLRLVSISSNDGDLTSISSLTIVDSNIKDFWTDKDMFDN